jgi:1-deoxy-D-xylulose-5-phosphate reductoisomerase
LVDTKTVSIFGATGSIGTSTLKVIQSQAGNYKLETVTAHKNANALAKLAIQCNAKRAIIAEHASYQDLKEALSGFDIEVQAGQDAVADAGNDNADISVCAIVGIAGLASTFNAVSSGKTVALANKEALVCAGDLLKKQARKRKANILPLDSEHNAIFQALQGNKNDSVSHICLTASGGPFRTWPLEKMETITVEDALNHPTWSMGHKITIDSASMANKGLEVIEAHMLFGFEPEAIDVLVHPQSIIHGMVHYKDGSILAQMSPPDMCTPIAFCLAYPNRLELSHQKLDLALMAQLTFEKPDIKRFPMLNLAYTAIENGPRYLNAYNAANEMAVEAFLHKATGFMSIANSVDHVMEKAEALNLLKGPIDTLQDAMMIDKECRMIAANFFKAHA